jgi:hypothetical protein
MSEKCWKRWLVKDVHPNIQGRYFGPTGCVMHSLHTDGFLIRKAAVFLLRALRAEYPGHARYFRLINVKR